MCKTFGSVCGAIAALMFMISLTGCASNEEIPPVTVPRTAELIGLGHFDSLVLTIPHPGRVFFVEEPLRFGGRRVRTFRCEHRRREHQAADDRRPKGGHTGPSERRAWAGAKCCRDWSEVLIGDGGLETLLLAIIRKQAIRYSAVRTGRDIETT